MQLWVKEIDPLGPLAPQTGHCDVDGVLAAGGSVTLAGASCEQELQMEAELGDDLQVTTASDLHTQARRRHLAGDLAGARDDYAEAIHLDADAQSPGAVTTVVRINLGLLDHEEGDQVGAMRHLSWVLDNSSDPATRGAAHHNLALVLLALGDTDAALSAALTAHRTLGATMGASHASVGATLNLLGVIHGERGQFDLAVETLQRAVEVRRDALGELHPATAASYTNLGVAHAGLGDHAAALVAHRRAIAIDEVVLGPDHPVTASDHAHVGAALVALGRPRAARSRFERALEILEPVREADDPEIARLRTWLSATATHGD
jgi:tetratricopeptide (TPR) repeat protein